MSIWTDKISGDVDIINGLNHYIGMKHISAEMFPEFKYIGILIGILIGVGLLAAVLGSHRVLFVFTLTSYLYAAAALWDFYRWGYDYGHNLDPNAAIKVPGMSYQPPVIGYKNLLNFTSYSGPDTGAWVIIAVCLVATAIWWWDFFKIRKSKRQMATSKLLAMLLATATAGLLSCSTEPEPLKYGKDECYHCKMTLTDKRYGAEVLTDKGKVYKFDDLNCLVNFLKSGEVPTGNAARILTIDFSKAGQFVDVNQAYFLENEALKSPMRADVASFSDKKDLESVKQQLGGGAERAWAYLMENL